MILMCNECNKSFKRDNNIYGTRCPYCGKFVKPENESDIVKGMKKRKQELQTEMLEKLKKNIEEG